MGLQDKYAKLIAYAKQSSVQKLSVAEKDGVLYVSGITTPSNKNKMWDIYNEIDPDMRAGDMILNIDEDGSEELYEVKAGDSLSKIAGKYPNMSWKKIFDANKDAIKDPDKIFPGQKIKIPR